MYAESVRQPDSATDRAALVSHLLSHLARSARAMRVATQLSSALGTTAISLTMSAVIPVLREEQDMLRALLLTLADPADTTWPTVESGRFRQLLETQVGHVDAAEALAPVEIDRGWKATDGQEQAKSSRLSEARHGALLDAMIEGCWGRLALWRTLAERSRLTSPHHAVDFASLARRTMAMIGELESLQGGVAASN